MSLYKKSWGNLRATWVPHDTRDSIVDFVRYWSDLAEVTTQRFISWIGISTSKFYEWKRSYGMINEHNCWIPGDFWLQEWEKQATLDFHLLHPNKG